VVTLHLVVRDLDDLRGALRPDAQGEVGAATFKRCASCWHRSRHLEPARGRLVGAGAAAAAAGLGWNLWRPVGADTPDDAFWSLRFDKPDGGELALARFEGGRCC